MFNRRMSVNMDKLTVQNLNLGVDLLQCGIVQKHDGFPLVNLAVLSGNMVVQSLFFFSKEASPVVAAPDSL